MERGDTDMSAEDPLQRKVAAAVAVVAVLMGLASVASGNVSQAMQLALVRSADYWNWYQSDKIRHEMCRYSLAQCEMLAQTVAEPQRALLEPQLRTMRGDLTAEATKMDESRANARRHDEELRKLTRRDDLLDMSEAAFSIAMALLAMTSLTGRQGLFKLAAVTVGLGTLAAIASLFG